MSLDEIVRGNRSRPKEHPAIREVLDDIFESGYPATLVREELREQVESHGIDVDPDAELPNTPYKYDKTSTLAEKWEVMLAEYMLCEESLPDRRYQQSASRATEHLDCGAGNSVTSALTRETFFEPFTLNTEQAEGPIDISAPSFELIRGILDESERRLRNRPDIIEQILESHEE